MKPIIILILSHFIIQITFAQTFESETITKDVLQRLSKEVEQEAAVFKKSISTNDNSKESIAFSLDTFNIERLAAKRSKLDHSTMDMNSTTSQMKDAYDKLLNKYYALLMGLLKTEDKETLKMAQKSWLSFRDNESKLIGTLGKKAYSGGGSIYRLIANSNQLDMIRDRVLQLYHYYTDAKIGQQ